MKPVSFFVGCSPNEPLKEFKLLFRKLLSILRRSYYDFTLGLMGGFPKHKGTLSQSIDLKKGWALIALI